MPVHDWSRVEAGIFHHFHHSWVGRISDALNDGLLSSGYYALAEQMVGSFGPDVLTLQAPPARPPSASPPNGNGAPAPVQIPGAVAVAQAPPPVPFTSHTEVDEYVRKQKSVIIHHSSDDRIIAVIEVVSPGNKNSRHGIRSFVEKVVGALVEGIHLLVLDLIPPGPRDPKGIHAAIWSEFREADYDPPPEKPLILVAYAARSGVTSYI